MVDDKEKLPGDGVGDGAVKADETPGMDFAREAEDEKKIQDEYVRRTLDEVETRRQKELIGKGARAIYEAVNGTTEEVEERKKIIENSLQKDKSDF